MRQTTPAWRCRCRSSGRAAGHPHIATTSDSRSLLFPTEEEIPADNRYARLLHDCSSPMPEELSEAIRQVRGDLAKPPFRGMSYNTSIAELIAILNIGSISIKIQ